jgi:integrase
MKALLSNSFVRKLMPKNKCYEAWDTKTTGFYVRINPSGYKSYRFQYARCKIFTIGNVELYTVAEAREQALSVLVDYSRGIEPGGNLKSALSSSRLTLKEFLEKDYKSWIMVNRKTGVKTINSIEFYFAGFMNLPLDEIKLSAVEKWRTRELKRGLQASSINRELNRLRAVLSKAVAWEYIAEHPLAKLKSLKIDVLGRIRYLTRVEESNLREVLAIRDERIKQQRRSGNKWREERSYNLFADLRDYKYGGHLTPMVLLTLNTGLRLGELFHLEWDKVTLDRKILSVVGRKSKTYKTLHVPLNEEAVQVLSAWRSQTSDKGLVFPGKGGKPLVAVRKSWSRVLEKAQIEDFHWHDLRHHFASRLVMNGVDLNTIRELLGHASLDMTLRYAHLAPEYKAKAVALLNN